MEIIIIGIILSIFIIGILSSTNPTRMAVKEEEKHELLKYNPETYCYK